MAAANQGDVEIILGDDVVTLKCTLGAAKRVNAIYGNYLEAFRQVRDFNMKAYSAVVAAALDKPVSDVEDGVFKTGMTDLVKPLSNYLNLLANGGRPPAPVEAADVPGNA